MRGCSSPMRSAASRARCRSATIRPVGRRCGARPRGSCERRLAGEPVARIVGGEGVLGAHLRALAGDAGPAAGHRDGGRRGARLRRRGGRRHGGRCASSTSAPAAARSSSRSSPSFPSATRRRHRSCRRARSRRRARTRARHGCRCARRLRRRRLGIARSSGGSTSSSPIRPMSNRRRSQRCRLKSATTIPISLSTAAPMGSTRIAPSSPTSAGCSQPRAAAFFEIGAGQADDGAESRGSRGLRRKRYTAILPGSSGWPSFSGNKVNKDAPRCSRTCRKIGLGNQRRNRLAFRSPYRDGRVHRRVKAHGRGVAASGAWDTPPNRTNAISMFRPNVRTVFPFGQTGLGGSFPLWKP